MAAGVFETCFKAAKKKQLGISSNGATTAAAIVSIRSKFSNVDKQSFTQAGGDQKHFAQEQRRGASKASGESQQSCMKDATGDKTTVNACRAGARKTYANAGG